MQDIKLCQKAFIVLKSLVHVRSILIGKEEGLRGRDDGEWEIKKNMLKELGVVIEDIITSFFSYHENL